MLVLGSLGAHARPGDHRAPARVGTATSRWQYRHTCAWCPGSPRGFYLGYGFTDTGRVMEGENVLALDLAGRN